MTQIRLLPHLAAVCKRTRTDAGVGAAKVAGEVPYSASTSISRTFEGAVSWPGDADAVVAAYAETAGVSVIDLWREAIDQAGEAQAKLARGIGPTAQPAEEGDPEKAAAKMAEAKRLREREEEDDATGTEGVGG